MAISSYLSDKILAEVLTGVDYTPPSAINVSLHRATTLAAGVTAGDSSIDVDDEIVANDNVKIVLEPQDSSAETHYAGSVTSNSDGSYTVSLVDSDGNGTTANNNHTSGGYVKFDPRDNLTEPSGGSYAQVAETFTKNDNHHYDNDNKLSFSDMPACMVTHAGLYDDESSSNLLWFGPLTDGSGNEVTKVLSSGDTLEIAAGDLDVTTGLHSA